MSEGTAPEPRSDASESVRLPPSKSKWIKHEVEKLQNTFLTDIAMLLYHHGDTDLAEAFCFPDSMLTNVALASGLSAERWTHQDYDLSTGDGCFQAEQRLRQLRPQRLWLSPECGPFSQMQNVNQKTPEQIKSLVEKGCVDSSSGKVVSD